MARRTATNTAVDRAQLLEFARSRHHVVLTHAPGRRATPGVTGGLRRRRRGRFVISTYPERAKATNVRRDPR